MAGQAQLCVRARPRQHRGARRRSHAGQVHRRHDADRRAGAAGSERRSADGPADRGDRFPRALSGPGVAGADGAGRRHADLPGAGRVRRGCAAPSGQDLRQRRPATAAALPGTGRRSSGGHRRRQGRSQPGPGPADLAAAGRHRRSDRRSRSPGQPRAALQPAVRAQRRGHRRADPHRAHHEDQALRLRVDWQRGRPDRAIGVHRGCRHPGHQPHPHNRRPTATATASGPARCCCARPTTCAHCRSRCFAAT